MSGARTLLKTQASIAKPFLREKARADRLPRAFQGGGNGYDFNMTQLLETAVAFVRRLPPEIQDDLARALLQLAGEGQPMVALSAEERSAIEISKAAAARGEFATDEQVRAREAVNK